MYCPFCHYQDTKVMDSRHITSKNSVKRRRKCEKCLKKFTTFENFEIQMPLVVKNDGRREDFQKSKIEMGIKLACQKRPVSMNQIQLLVKEIENELITNFQQEVTSQSIGQIVMDKVKSLDPVAYVRFASVYKTFKDVNEFVQKLH